MDEFQFNCPQCGQHILVTAKWSGRRMACPSCETRFIIPAMPGKNGGAPSAARPAIVAPPKVKVRVKLPTKPGALPPASPPPGGRGRRRKP